MNLQQVKATADDIGDGGEDITAESLTKYEKACMDLGVALKEVKNGVWVLRDPMKILNDLAVAFNNEADDSIKKANLINAVGGKYRGNQLSSLLSNWKTYEKMLAEFNSSDAVGSAMEESMKSANSWEGSLNKVSDSWYKLVNEFINSEDAIDVLNSLNVIIQKIAEDRTVGALGGVTDTLAGIFDILSKIIDAVGIIPTTIATIGTVQAFKGNSIFGNIVDVSKNSEKSISRMVTAFKELKVAQSTLESFNIDLSRIMPNDLNTLQEYVDLINKDVDVSTAFNQVLSDSSKNLQDQAIKFSNLHQACVDGKISQEQYTAATRNLAATQRVATGTTKALQFALNLMGNIAFTVVVTGIVKLIEAFATAEEKAIQKSEELVQKMQDANNAYKEEQDKLGELTNKYIELQTATGDVSDIKTDLLSLQDKVIEKYGEEADAVDLLNGKYSENISLLDEQRKKTAEKYLQDNAPEIRRAEDVLVNNKKQKKISFDVATFTVSDLDKLRELENSNNTIDLGGGSGSETSVKVSKGSIDEQIQALSDLLDTLNSFEGDYGETVYSEIVSARDRLIATKEELENTLKTAEESRKFLADLAEIEDNPELKSQFDNLVERLISEQQNLNRLVAENETGNNAQIQQSRDAIKGIVAEAYSLAGDNTELQNKIKDITKNTTQSVDQNMSAVEAVSLDFKEILGESYDNVLGDVDKIKSAMQKLANGEMLEWNEVSTLLFDIDTDKILGDFEEIGGKYRMVNGDMSTMITLKDSILKKQLEEINGIKTEHKETLELLKAELELNKARLSRSQSSTDAEYFKGKISGIESEMEDVNNLIRDDNILIGHLNSQLGDTVDHTEDWKKQQEKLNEELEKAQNAADNYAKAMTSKIDSIIESHENEKDLLESEKDALDEQLDALEEHQNALEEIIDQHKSLVDIVKEVTDNEIELLKEQQEAQESAIDEKIKALEDARDKQNEENELLEKEIDLQEKLRDLEKARQTKVRTYSESRGWHFDVDKEAVANAQTAANEAQAAYDKAVEDKAFNEQVDALEKEKELIANNFEAQIKAYEDYYKQWSEIVEDQTNAENEQLAQQLLGVEWREKIKKKDTDILNKFNSNFRDYNSQLDRLVNSEIASLKTSIKAKEEEIKAKDEQIQSWQNYKAQVEQSISEIKSQYDGYVEYLGSIALSENSTYEEREQALGDFVSHYGSCIEQIQELQNTLGDLSTTITVDVDTWAARNQMADFMETYREGVIGMYEMLRASSTGYGVVNSAWDAQLADAANLMYEWGMNIDAVIARLRGYSTGGVSDHTGLAMLHGTKQKAETIFNAQQSKQLYDMVKTDSFSGLVAQKAVEGLAKSLTTTKSTSNFNNSQNNTSVVIQRMEIKADNPAQFHDQFQKEINQYMRIELAKSRVM